MHLLEGALEFEVTKRGEEMEQNKLNVTSTGTALR